MARARAEVKSAFIEGLRPPRATTVSEWADDVRVLSQVGAAEPGRYKTDRTPYMRDPMDDLSITSPVQTVVFMKSARVGGSEGGNNWIGYVIDVAPGPMMMVQPTENTAANYIKTKVDSMIEVTPELYKKILGDSTMFRKMFPGGVLQIANAHSAKSLRAVDARFLMLDEVDAYPVDVDNEGDPVNLARKRTANFGGRSKIYIVSTPTIKGSSRIEALFLQGDQRRYFVPCPHCDELQYLKFDNLKWPEGKPGKAAYYCEHCGGEIKDHHKTQMLAKGEWRATAQTDRNIRSYHINALYAPAGWSPTFGDIAQEFVDARGNPAKLKAFVNTVLGETWEERGEAPDHERIYERREDYSLGIAPDSVLLITAGVDVQKDRIEAHVWGWNDRGESWLLDHIIYEGQTSDMAVWRKLDELRDRKYASCDVGSIPISRIVIDAGYESMMVYQWARSRPSKQVMVIFGRDILVPLGNATRTEVDNKGRKFGMVYYPVGSNVLKSDLYGRLNLGYPKDGEPYPERWVHISTAMDMEFCQQLTAEEIVMVKKKTGHVKREWQKVRDRNEALDCWVYARAGALEMGVERFNKEHWDALKSQYASSTPKPKKKKKSSWVNGGSGGSWI